MIIETIDSTSLVVPCLNLSPRPVMVPRKMRRTRMTLPSSDLIWESLHLTHPLLRPWRRVSRLSFWRRSRPGEKNGFDALFVRPCPKGGSSRPQVVI